SGSWVSSAITANAIFVDESFATATSWLDLRSRGSQRRLARTLDDSRRAWLATMGRMDPAVLSVRRVRSLERSMVLVRLLVGRRQLRLVASRFYLRHRTLSVPFYQLMLQPSITALAGWLVIEGSIFVGSFWITTFAYHAAMDAAPALPCRIGAVRARIGATSPRSRPARADCDRSAVAADVRTAGSDA